MKQNNLVLTGLSSYIFQLGRSRSFFCDRRWCHQPGEQAVGLLCSATIFIVNDAFSLLFCDLKQVRLFISLRSSHRLSGMSSIGYIIYSIVYDQAMSNSLYRCDRLIERRISLISEIVNL